MILRHRQYDRHGRIQWGPSLVASLAASNAINLRVGRLSRPLVRALGGHQSS